MENPFDLIRKDLAELKELVQSVVTQKPEKKYYSIRQATVILGCTYTHLYRLYQSGQISGAKSVGKKILIPHSYVYAK